MALTSEQKKISLSEAAMLMNSTKLHDYAYRQGLVPRNPADYLVFGTFVHAVFHRVLDPEAEPVVPSVAVQMEHATDPQYQRLTPTQVKLAEKLVADWVKDSEVKHQVEDILTSEHEFLEDVGLRDLDGNTVYFHGIIDLVTKDTDGCFSVREFKTASRAWNNTKFMFQYQGPLYAHVWELITGEPVERAVYHIMLANGTQSARTMELSPDHTNNVLNELQQAVWLRDSGIILRNPMGEQFGDYTTLSLVELLGGDASDVKARDFVVDSDRVRRFADD